MRNRLAALTAIAACLAAGAALADQRLGYDFTSETGPQIAWIIADDSGYPDVAAPAATIDSQLLALSDSDLGAFTYQPMSLGALDQPLGYQFESAAGPQMAWVPADSSDYNTSEFLASTTAQAEQLGAVPQEEPETR